MCVVLAWLSSVTRWLKTFFLSVISRLCGICVFTYLTILTTVFFLFTHSMLTFWCTDMWEQVLLAYVFPWCKHCVSRLVTRAAECDEISKEAVLRFISDIIHSFLKVSMRYKNMSVSDWTHCMNISPPMHDSATHKPQQQVLWACWWCRPHFNHSKLLNQVRKFGNLVR